MSTAFSFTQTKNNAAVPFSLPASPQRVLFMRHPETEANVKRFFSGRKNVDLTEHGLEQRKHAVCALVAFKPDRIWTSPLSRCRDMAQLAADQLGISIEVKDDLSEMDFGILEGTRFADAHQMLEPLGLSFPWRCDEEGHSMPAPGAESYEEVRIRCRSILNDLSQCAGKTVCISHGGYLRSMMAEIFGAPNGVAWNMHLANVSSIFFTSNHGFDYKLGGFNLDPEEIIRRATEPSFYDFRDIWGVTEGDR